MATTALPRVRMAHLPTPVEPLPRLSAALGGVRLWIKRDDQTGLALGGNKTRKLEYLVAQAQADDARTLITRGAPQSNHCRQTAAAAARFGFDCMLVLRGSPPPQPNGNLLLDRLLGAELVWCGDRDPEMVLRETFDEAQTGGRRPYLIPYGGSSPTGALAYAEAIREFQGQGIEVDRIVFASSSGGTQAGMVAGSRAYRMAARIYAISVDQPAAQLQAQVATLAGEVAELIGGREAFDASAIEVDDRFLGGGYGVLSDREREAIGLFARMEGILLDPVYTGRAAAGLLELIRSREISPEERVLFWHTGGTPALFAYADLL